MADIDNILAQGIGPALQQGATAGYYNAQARHLRDEAAARQQVAPLVPQALAGDPNAMGAIAARSPTTAASLAPILSRLDASQKQKVKEAADYTVGMATGLLTAPPESRAALYDQAKLDAAQKGHDTTNWPQAWGPQTEAWVRFQMGKGVSAKEYFAEQEKMRRHQTPGAVQPSGGDLVPMGGGPAAPAAVVPGRQSAVVTPQPTIAQATPPAAPQVSPQTVAPQVTAAAVPASAAPADGAIVPAAYPSNIPTPSFSTPQTPDLPPHMVSMTVPGMPRFGSPSTITAEAPQAVDAGNIPPVQLAQATGGPQTPAPAPPKGAIWETDPSLQGGVMMGHRAKPGAPLLPAEIAGHFVYRMPDGTTVLYKGREVPQGYERDPTKPGALRPIVGGPADLSRKNVQIGITPENENLHGEEFLATLPKGDQNMISGLLDGSLAIGDLSKRAQDYTRYLALAKQADPSFDPGPAGARRNFETKFMVSGPGGTTILAANTAADHMKTYRNLMEALDNGDARAVNAALNYVRSQFGDAAATNAEAAKTILSTEIAKAVRGAGALNENEQKDYQRVLSTAQSAKSAQGTLEVLTNLMLGRVHAIEDMAKARGIPDNQVNNYLSPRAREALDYIRNSPIKGSQEPSLYEKGKALFTGGNASQAPAQPKSEAEYNALPRGTPYIHPDGSTRVKP